ncbi:unnamed protein product [Soboliphyme baturini]|uniref:MAM domain-containing protein n=1 Tax=Soboliphyme baturini TaxID=241478 RepID=A0A183IC35_9BILA|nr:unnamed protein product [Soboliphyme baturini]
MCGSLKRDTLKSFPILGYPSSDCSHYFRKGFRTNSHKVGNRHTGIRLEYSGPFGYVTGPGNVTIVETKPFDLSEWGRLTFCYYNAGAESYLTVNLFSNERKITIYESPEVDPMEPHKWNCIAKAIDPGNYNTLQINAKKLRNELSYIGIDEINLTDMQGSTVC